MRERREGNVARTSMRAAIGAGRDIEPRRIQVHVLGDTASPYQQNRLDPLILECQLLGGRIADGTRISCADIGRLVDVLPQLATVPERLAIRNLFATVFGRTIASTDIALCPDATHAFLTWTASNATSDTWLADISCLLEMLRSVLVADDDAAPAGLDNPRVVRALAFIARHHADANMTLCDVAAVVNLSRWHFARMLKQQTGLCFTSHLRQRRISEAQRLLRQTSLSIKEVAALVGYGDASQFGRHFKKWCGQAPATFRRPQHKKTINSNN